MFHSRNPYRSNPTAASPGDPGKFSYFSPRENLVPSVFLGVFICVTVHHTLVEQWGVSALSLTVWAAPASNLIVMLVVVAFAVAAKRITRARPFHVSAVAGIIGLAGVLSLSVMLWFGGSLSLLPKLTSFAIICALFVSKVSLIVGLFRMRYSKARVLWALRIAMTLALLNPLDIVARFFPVPPTVATVYSFLMLALLAFALHRFDFSRADRPGPSGN